MPCDSPISVSRTIRNGGTTSRGKKQVFGRWTFEYERAREFVEERLDGRVLNACAGKTKLNHDGEIVRNDLNPDRDADIHVPVEEVADHFPSQSFDTVVFDPPFDDLQAEDKYDSLRADSVLGAFDQFVELVRPQGTSMDLLYRFRQRVRLWRAKYRSWKYRREIERAEQSISREDDDEN